MAKSEKEEKKSKTPKTDTNKEKSKAKKEKVVESKKEVIEDATLITKTENPKKETKLASFIERLGALILDFMIISLVVSLLTYPLSNTNSENYKKLSKELQTTIEQYRNGKIDSKTYLNRSADINYDISRETGLSSLISVFIFSLYFIIFQYKNKGQTIGKKLLKIRVKKVDNSELTINDIMFRSLIIDFILYDIISLCLTIFSSKDIYFYGVLGFELIQYAVIFISAIMILSRKDKRGLHDIITHTQVIKES